MNIFKPASFLLATIALTILPLSPYNNLYAYNLESPKITNLLFVGDMHFEGKILKSISEGKDPFASVKTILNSGDLVIGNLETAVTEYAKKNPKQYNFKTKIGNLQYLKDANIGLLSVANNHTFDYGMRGFNDTLNALDNTGIDFVGGGNFFFAAHAGKVYRINNKNYCFLAYARVNGGNLALNNSKKSGINDGYHDQQIISDIKNIKLQNNCFKTILLQHWGVENSLTPRSREKSGAQLYLKNGVDIVIGTHPHVWQPIELSKNKLVAYSLGNFLFYSTKELNRNTGILQVSINVDSGEITYKQIKVTISNETGFPELNKNIK